MKIVGTPPTKTPELYEKYLPYAIALGVEEQWTAQFAPIFAQMMQPHTVYRPDWYTGDSSGFTFNDFSSNISSSLSSTISTSAPGSSPGADGGGDSGGGGGGSW